MKYKNKVAYLQAKKNWFDKLPNSVQSTLTRPGSIKTT